MYMGSSTATGGDAPCSESRRDIQTSNGRPRTRGLTRPSNNNSRSQHRRHTSKQHRRSPPERPTRDRRHTSQAGAHAPRAGQTTHPDPSSNNGAANSAQVNPGKHNSGEQTHTHQPGQGQAAAAAATTQWEGATGYWGSHGGGQQEQQVQQQAPPTSQPGRPEQNHQPSQGQTAAAATTQWGGAAWGETMGVASKSSKCQSSKKSLQEAGGTRGEQAKRPTTKV